ncbi:hypothetical protein ANN_09254 [Periplaneta americana]|uniref:Uncharacterized protein n=1 Tax=Periplaneta americana TaxID=6978 RepID=A0ABQ8TKX8_PERAM|nr:hypothetical protein ANN_09254 [Periplaneta americana]
MKLQLHTEPRPQIVSSTELLSIVRSRNMFAFSSDERAFNIESYFRTGSSTVFHTDPSHSSLTVTVRSKNMFAFSNDERAFNIASFSQRFLDSRLDDKSFSTE